MALILHEKYRLEKINYFDFVASRFLRIFPSYFVVLFLTIALSLLSAWNYEKSMGPVVLWWQNWVQFDWSTKVFLIVTHLGLLGQDAFYFLGLDKLGGLYLEPNLWINHNEFYKFMFVPQAWSLSLELYFYLLVPFLVRRSVPMLALIILASLGIRLLLMLCFGWKSDPWAYRFFPSELALFLCGAAVYRVYGVAKVKKMDVRTWLGWCLIGMAACAALLINHYPGGFIMWKNIGYFVAIVLALPFLFKLTKHSKIDSFIGELSYPMYLCHMLVIWLFQLIGVTTGVQWSIGVLLVTLLLSVILYWCVDRNISAYRHKIFPATA
jgi:peptidoglycan/LPS O-acetylase OafA/YrhL